MDAHADGLDGVGSGRASAECERGGEPVVSVELVSSHEFSSAVPGAPARRMGVAPEGIGGEGDGDGDGEARDGPFCTGAGET